MMSCAEVVRYLKANAVAANREGMARYGIVTDKALGVSMPKLRKLAAQLRKNHELALELWKTGLHEALILAALIDDPSLVTEQQMERWVKDFDSWDVCDQVCSNLFDKTAFAWKKPYEWTKSPATFVKRAGFVMMAALAVHDKRAAEKDFLPFLKIIGREAVDDRNFVKKAVNWALRQIGKRRDSKLLEPAMKLATKLAASESRSARWIGSDARRELERRQTRRI